MPERLPRIPDIDPSSLPPQEVQVVDESFTAFNPDAREAAIDWVRNHNRLNQMISDGNSPIAIERAENLLDDDFLLDEAETLFRMPTVAAAFDQLITRYVTKTGRLEEVLEKVDPTVDKPENRIFEALNGERLSANGDRYRFAQKFVDYTTSPEIRRELVRLHTEALKDAERTLMEHLPQDEQDFTDALKDAVERGVLPQSVLVDEIGDPVRAKRIKEVKVKVSDPVLYAVDDFGGHYEPENNTIRLGAQNVSNDQLRRVLYAHERMHSYAGLLLRVEPVFKTVGFDLRGADAEEFEEYLKDEQANRLDVAEEFVNDSNGANRLVPSFEGLARGASVVDEGYTEWVAMELTGNGYDHTELWTRFLAGESLDDLEDDFLDIQLEDRILLAGLVVAGIDILALGEAYVESYQPKRNNKDREPGQTLPKHRALDQLIAKRTIYRSLYQLQRGLQMEARRRSPNLDYHDEVLLMAKIFAEQMAEQSKAA